MSLNTIWMDDRVSFDGRPGVVAVMRLHGEKTAAFIQFDDDPSELSGEWVLVSDPRLKVLQMTSPLVSA